MAVTNEHHPKEREEPEPPAHTSHVTTPEDPAIDSGVNLDNVHVDEFLDPPQDDTPSLSITERAYIDRARTTRKRRITAITAVGVGSLLFGLGLGRCSADSDTPASHSDAPAVSTTVPCLIVNHAGCPPTTFAGETIPETPTSTPEAAASNFDITRILPTDDVLTRTLPNGKEFKIPRLRVGAERQKFVESGLGIATAFMITGDQDLLNEFSSYPQAREELQKLHNYYKNDALPTYRPENRSNVVANMYTDPNDPVSFDAQGNNIINKGSLYISVNADQNDPTEWGDDNIETVQNASGRTALNTTLLELRILVDNADKPTKIFEFQIGGPEVY